MICIFCKNDSTNSRSIEHIIPESLGNLDHTLPRGLVCDGCNNYFARKLEKPILDSDYFTQARFRKMIPNKRGNVPPLGVIAVPSVVHCHLLRHSDGSTSVGAVKETDSNRFVNSLQTHRRGKFVFPFAAPIDDYLISRFLAKVGMEVLTARVINIPGWEEEFVFREEMDEIRQFARYGAPGKPWPYHTRRIYPEDFVFVDKSGEAYEILHEFTTLYTESQQLYAIIAILGVEYAINLGDPSIDSYRHWLGCHNGVSPLYTDEAA